MAQRPRVANYEGAAQVQSAEALDGPFIPFSRSEISARSIVTEVVGT